MSSFPMLQRCFERQYAGLDDWERRQVNGTFAPTFSRWFFRTTQEALWTVVHGQGDDNFPYLNYTLTLIGIKTDIVVPPPTWR